MESERPHARDILRPKCPLARGAAVVRRTLRATLSELSRVGYAALRIEDVAARAKVNKTTVYRRWPTKEALVRAALLSIAEEVAPLIVIDTGSLEGDLELLTRHVLNAARSPEARTIVRLVAGGEGDPELTLIARSVRETREAVARAVLERARLRGELRWEVDTSLFLEIFRATFDRLLLSPEGIDERRVHAILNSLLFGALSDSARARGAWPRPSSELPRPLHAED